MVGDSQSSVPPLPPKLELYVNLAAEEVGLILVYVTHRFPSAEADVENLGSYAAWPNFQIGEFEEGLRLLVEDEELLTRLGEIRAVGWVRLALGIISLRQDQAAKVAETFAGIVESADTIGYQRTK